MMEKITILGKDIIKKCKLIYVLSFLLIVCLFVFGPQVSYLYDNISVFANIQNPSIQATHISEASSSRGGDQKNPDNRNDNKKEILPDKNDNYFIQFGDTIQYHIKANRNYFTMPQWVSGLSDIGPKEQAVIIAEGYGLIDDGEEIFSNPSYASIVVTRVEAIQLLVLLKTQFTVHTFKSNTYIDKELIFPDMKRDGWYVPYVLYAFEKGWLHGFLEQGDSLNPYGIITYDEMVKLFQGFGGETVNPNVRYTTQQVSKGDFVYYLISAFNKRFESTRIMWGNNTILYRNLLKLLKNKSLEQQEKIIDLVIDKVSTRNPNDRLKQNGYDVWGIEYLLDTILSGSKYSR